MTATRYFMPAEWAKQKQTWMLWPERPDNWRLGAKPAQAAFTLVARAIARFQPVTVGVNADQYDNAYNRLKHPNIRVVELSSDDAWVRDTGPTFVLDQQGQLAGIDWEFNAWGGLQGGLYFPWQRDDQVARKILQLENCQSIRTEGLVLEGGAFHVDGEGTLLTTAECLLNPNRNPNLTAAAIEAKLKQYLGVEKIIWLPEGLFNDETNGHVDNFCCFVCPGEVLLAWTDDPQDPNYARCQAALAVLTSTQDAKGRSLKVHKMPLPQAVYATAEECAGVDWVIGSQPREPSQRLAASYVNFLLVNGGVIAPSFGVAEDVLAANLLEKLFPERKVILLPSREILLGGGNIHCITQQQPAVTG
ncbi:agmatine deiminase [Marinospirillum minutulum]|uniref:agmatine deiminase n=1 Tax=Marinospirillum minutulum TaxID=64974 RepID=UPI0004281920|nr:agmatine deiminase [Marinospirillum minutulum]